MIHGLRLGVTSIAEPVVLVRSEVGGPLDTAEGVVVAAVEDHMVVLLHAVKGVVKLGRRPRRER